MAWVLLNRTSFGRYTYAVGGNAEASRLVGDPGPGRPHPGLRHLQLLHRARGDHAVLARLLGLPDLGNGLEITAIAAVFIGGVAWGGGAGSVIGAVLGVALLSVLSNGLDLNAVNSNIQTMIIGALILLAVGVNNLRGRRNAV